MPTKKRKKTCDKIKKNAMLTINMIKDIVVVRIMIITLTIIVIMVFTILIIFIEIVMIV
jgi:hypothetical protein